MYSVYIYWNNGTFGRKNRWIVTHSTRVFACQPNQNLHCMHDVACLHNQNLHCMHDNLQIVREVARPSYLFCFFRQSTAANRVQVTRSLDSAWKFRNRKLKTTLVYLPHMFRPAQRSTQSSLQWVQVFFHEYVRLVATHTHLAPGWSMSRGTWLLPFFCQLWHTKGRSLPLNFFLT